MAVIREPGFEYSLMANLKFMFRYKVTVIKVIFTRQTSKMAMNLIASTWAGLSNIYAYGSYKTLLKIPYCAECSCRRTASQLKMKLWPKLNRKLC